MATKDKNPMVSYVNVCNVWTVYKWDTAFMEILELYCKYSIVLMENNFVYSIKRLMLFS